MSKSRLHHHLRLIRKFTQTFWQVMAQYRLGGILWVINGMVTPLILMAVWLVMNHAQNLPLTNHQIVSYFFLSIIVVRLTQTWTAEDLTNSIKEGRFSIYLLKPYSFIHERLGKDLALRLIRVLTLLPFMILMTLILSGQLEFHLTPDRIGLFILVLAVGYLVNFILEILVGILTFWLEDAYGAFMLLNLVRDVLSGILIPFALMPPFLKQWAINSPFYVQVGLPIDILTGNLTPGKAWGYLALSTLWIIGIMLISLKVYSKLIKNYTAVGI